jgi:hypothetical protein
MEKEQKERIKKICSKAWDTFSTSVSRLAKRISDSFPEYNADWGGYAYPYFDHHIPLDAVRIPVKPRNNKEGDLVAAALDHADNAVQVAEDLLERWYKLEQDAMPVSWRGKKYEKEMAKLHEEYVGIRNRLTKLKAR